MKIKKNFVFLGIACGFVGLALVKCGGDGDGITNSISQNFTNLTSSAVSGAVTGESDVPFYKDSNIDWKEEFNSLDKTRWTAEVTASGGGNFEFQYYNDSSDNLFIKNGKLILKPGLTNDYQIVAGQALKNATGGSSPAAIPSSPGSGSSSSGIVTSGSIGEFALLGCGKSTSSQATDVIENNGCPVWGPNQVWWLDMGTQCTDNGSSVGVTGNGGCVLSSGYFVGRKDGCKTLCSPPNYSYYSIMKPVTSARISTKNSSDGFFKYGRLEVKAKTPRGDWLWPAIWMLPKSTVPITRDLPAGKGIYDLWPKSGEIDIMEARGNARECSEDFMRDNPKINAGGVQSFGSTLHWGWDYQNNAFRRTHTEYSVPDNAKTLNEGFHIYGLRWNDKGLYTYLDDDANHVLEVSFEQQSFEQRATQSSQHCLKRGARDSASFNCRDLETVNAMSTPSSQIWPTKQGPFDQEFYLILNVAVGFADPNAGSLGYFPDRYCNKPWKNADVYPIADFYAEKDTWFPTWTGGSSSAISNDAGLQVSEIRYWKEENAGSFSVLQSPGD